MSGNENTSTSIESTSHLESSEIFDKNYEATLDKDIERLLRDIDNLLGMRQRDSLKLDNKKSRFSIIPVIRALSSYKEYREKWLEQLLYIPYPEFVDSGVPAIKDLLENKCNLKSHYSKKNILLKLIHHYYQKIISLVEEKALILERVKLICKSENAIIENQEILLQKFVYIRESLCDAIERYDLLLINNNLLEHAMSNNQSDKNKPDYKFASGDLLVYANDKSQLFHHDRDFNFFLQRIKHLTTTDLESLAEAVYKIYSSPPLLRNYLPKKKPQVKEFLYDYEALASWFKIDVPLELEDGRAFAYYCDHLFHNNFSIFSAKPPPSGIEQPFTVQTLGDNFINNLSKDTSKPLRPHSDLPDLKIVKSLWVDKKPNFFSAVEDETLSVHLYSQKSEKIDFQIRYEHDIITTENFDSVKQHLHISLKYLTESELLIRRDLDGEDLKKADNNNNSSINTSRKLGIRLPLIEEGQVTFNLKRQKIKEASNPQSHNPLASYTSLNQLSEVPLNDVSVFFAPHELLSFLQLRYLKTRELRLILLHQLNFFRSIEKRLVLDSLLLPEDWTPTIDPIFFETGSPLYESKRLIRKRDLDPINALDKLVDDEEGHEDVRIIKGRLLYVFNEAGENVIYDTAYDDLAHTELQLLRHATLFINRSSSENEKKDLEFLERTKARLFDPKVFTESSFCAPEIDRQQVLIDLLESEVKLNDRKVMLTNAWMEIYEHTTWPSQKRELIKHIMGIIKMPLEINENDPYPLLTTHYQCKNLESQELLIIEIFNHLVSKQSTTDEPLFNFHHHEARVFALTDIILGHWQILDLPSLVKNLLHELESTLSLHLSASKPLFESVIWDRFLHCWTQLKQSGFQLPPTPSPLLFREDLLTYPGSVQLLLKEVLGRGKLESEVLTSTADSDLLIPLSSPILEERSIVITTLYLECLKGYRLLKESWLQTHYLRARLFQQAKTLGVSIKLILPPFSGNLFNTPRNEKKDYKNSFIAEDDDDDDDEDFLSTNDKKAEDVSIDATLLAIQEICEEWGQISLESKSTVINFLENGTSLLQDILKCQIIEMISCAAMCETNFFIYNRLEEVFKPNHFVPIFSGDYLSVAFLAGAFKKLLRKQLLTIYNNESQKLLSKLDKDADIQEVELYSCKSKALTFYFSKWCEILQENCARILVLKQARIMPNAILNKSSNKSSILYFKTEGEVHNNETSTISHDTVADMESGAGIRVWTAPANRDILSLHRNGNSNSNDVKIASSSSFSKLFQVYVLTEEIRRLSKLIGDYQMERGNDFQRQAISSIKKEVLNFGFPIDLNKLINYLRLRWNILTLQLRAGILSSSYSMLTLTHSHSDIEPNFALQIYYERIVSLSLPKPILQLFYLITPKKFESFYVSNLSVREKKMCSEKFTELEGFLEEIYHRTNLESLEVEDALESQISYLFSNLQLYKYRFELLSILGKRRPIKQPQINSYLNFYKLNIQNPSYKEFILMQHQKGSHIEDVTLSKSAQLDFETCQLGILKSVTTSLYSMSIIKGLRNVFDILVDERTEALFNQHEFFQIPRPYLIQNYPLVMDESDFLQKSKIFEDFMHQLISTAIKPSPLHGSNSSEKPNGDDKHHVSDHDHSHLIIKREQLSLALITLATRLASWDQIKLREIDGFYSELHSISSSLISKQKNLIETYRFEKKMLMKEYERDVRLGASVKASDIYLELSTLGSELSELKKARKLEERAISQRLRQEYEDLVAELSSQIHKLKARFNEFRINSLDEAMSLLSNVKREDLLSFIKKDYSQSSNDTGKTILDMQEVIDELRSDNSELKQVLSKLKSMYVLKDRTSKIATSKKFSILMDEKRSAEERLWDSFRENEAREKALRKTLIKCQKDLVSFETQTDALKKELKEEQKARQSLQKSFSSRQQDNDPNLELNSIRKIENFSRFEFEKLLLENKQFSCEITSLKKEVSRLQTIIQAQEWRQATRQRLKSQSAATFRRDTSSVATEEISLCKTVPNFETQRPLTAKKEIFLVPAIKVPTRPNSVVLNRRSAPPSFRKSAS